MKLQYILLHKKKVFLHLIAFHYSEFEFFHYGRAVNVFRNKCALIEYDWSKWETWKNSTVISRWISSYKSKKLSNRNMRSPTLIHVFKLFICVGIMDGVKEKMRKNNENNIDFLLSFSIEELWNKRKYVRLPFLLNWLHIVYQNI